MSGVMEVHNYFPGSVEKKRSRPRFSRLIGVRWFALGLDLCSSKLGSCELSENDITVQGWTVKEVDSRVYSGDTKLAGQISS